MLDTLFELGIALGLLLSGLLFCAVASEKFQFWPTPGNGSWQGLLFWGLFRGLNVSTLALAAISWQPWEEFSVLRSLGAVLSAVCFALYFWALHVLGRANVYCGREGLVTDGIYAWTRNPQYATAIPAYLGIAIASSSAAVLAVALLLMLSFVLMAFAEERWLEAAYGARYLQYREEVARFYNWRRAWVLLKREVMPPRPASGEPVPERP
jgi:protein-S-isoprenylcysteine O-methyltransferase Ste14